MSPSLFHLKCLKLCYLLPVDVLLKGVGQNPIARLANYPLIIFYKVDRTLLFILNMYLEKLKHYIIILCRKLCNYSYTRVELCKIGHYL